MNIKSICILTVTCEIALGTYLEPKEHNISSPISKVLNTIQYIKCDTTFFRYYVEFITTKMLFLHSTEESS